MVYSSWRRSPREDSSFVVKLVASILPLSLVFLLLYNSPSNVSRVSDVHFLENTKTSASPVSFINSQENTDQIPAQEYGTKSIHNEGKCDLSVGDWVPYQAEPLYNKSCSFIIDHQNCIKNGRPDTDYLYWRWKPHGCELPRFDPARFLKLMRNKSWAFIGDSISRNHVESLICMLSTVEKAVLVYHDESYRSHKWLFPFYNFTASVVWSPFLAKAVIPEDLDGVSAPEIELHLDILDKNWTEQYKTSDYIIFSSGKWFSKSSIYYENNTLLGCHYCPKRNCSELGLDFGYRKVIRSVLDYIITSSHKGTIFYRTVSPDHFEGADWFDGGTCKRKVPAKEGEFELRMLDKILLDIDVEEFEKASIRASENGINLRLFDVSRMSLLRPDGHPGVYGFYQPSAENKKAKVIIDCLHWCLPGPIDTWNDLLMKIIAND